MPLTNSEWAWESALADDIPDQLDPPTSVQVLQVAPARIQVSWDLNPVVGRYEVVLYETDQTTRIKDELGNDVTLVTTDRYARLAVPMTTTERTVVARVEAQLITGYSFGSWTFSDSLTVKTQFDSVELAPGAIFDLQVSPNTIGSAELKPIITVGEGGFTAINTPENPGQLSISAEGLQLTDASTETVVRLPTDGGIAAFKGQVQAVGLTTEGTSQLGGSHIVKGSSSVTLSAGQTKAPNNAPTVSNFYPTNRLFSESANRWGIFIDSNGTSAQNTKSIWTALPFATNAFREYSMAGTGSMAVSRTLSVSGEAHAICKAGGQVGVTEYLYALFYRSSSTMWVNAYSPSTLALVKSQSISVNSYEPTLIKDIGKDNTLVLIDTNSTGTVTALRFRSYSVDSTGTLTLQATATVSVSGLASSTQSSITATMKDASTFYLSAADTVKESVIKITVSTRTNGYITALALGTGTDASFQAPWGAAPWGLAYDSTLNSNAGGFWVHSGSGSLLYSSSTSTDASTYQFAYTFENSDATPKTTVLGANKRSITRIPYTNLTITATESLPTTATKYAFYAKKTSATAWTGFYKQSTAQASTTLTLSTLSNTGSGEPASNTFTGGTAASIYPETAGWSLNGDGTTSGIVPVGMVSAYAGSTAPSGWLLCNGSLVSRTTYSDLFAVISTTYGAGDGSTTFALPNLTQRFPLGKASSGTGATLGGTGGSIDHGHTFSGSGSASSTAHSHTDSGHTHGNTLAVATGTTGSSHTHGAGTLANASHTHSFSDTSSGASALNGSFASGTNAGATGHTHTIGGTTGSATPNITGDTNGTGSTHNHNATLSGGVSSASATSSSETVAVSVSVSGTIGTQNPPFLVLNYIIKV